MGLRAPRTSPSPGGLLLLVLATATVTQASDWSYGNQATWSGLCPSGKHQSPINIQTNQVVERKLTTLQFTNYNKAYPATLTNNGHTVQLKLETGSDQIMMTGGGLPDDYVVDHLHFHWGSEHTVNSNRFSLELHIVHYSKGFNSTSAAIANGSQQVLAVLGVVYDIFPLQNPAFGKSFKAALSSVKNKVDSTEQLSQSVKIIDFLPKDISGFYRYEGSLTTPSCNEVVIWTVLSAPAYVSTDVISDLKTVKSSHGPLTENFRKLQSLNGRTVTVKKSTVSGGKKMNINHALLAFILCMFIFK